MMRIEALNWPRCPERLDGIALILLDLPHETPREKARLMARAVVRNAAARLLKRESITLVETPSGPWISEGLHVSLSYAEGKALIGLSSDRPLGVDIVKIASIPEADALAGLYLPSSRKVADFELNWARMEACCKALNLPLAEMDEAREMAYASCDLPECSQIEGYRMAVAFPARSS